MPPLTPEERDELARARALLERRSLVVSAASFVGRPLERGIERLPDAARARVNRLAREALERAFDVALSTLGDEEEAQPGRSHDRRHRLASAASGALGGWFGLAGLAVELPITTVIMLRSIADVARGEGHDLADPATRLACLEVFALGGPAREDDAAEAGYWAVRAALAKSFTEAAEQLAARGAARGATPALVRAVERVATRFGLVVQEKVLLEAVPLLGAATGAVVNTAFLAHYQGLARGHFVVRRLEGRHGHGPVQAEYAALANPRGLPRASEG